jgi:hypothetical protein
MKIVIPSLALVVIGSVFGWVSQLAGPALWGRHWKPHESWIQGRSGWITGVMFLLVGLMILRAAAKRGPEGRPRKRSLLLAGFAVGVINLLLALPGFFPAVGWNVIFSEILGRILFVVSAPLALITSWDFDILKGGFGTVLVHIPLWCAAMLIWSRSFAKWR